MALLNVNTQGTEAQPDYTPIPAGDYTAKIIDSDYKETSKGGHYISLKFEVLDGPHAGRFVFENLNVDNQSEKCQEIAYQKLAALQDAIGVSRQLTDTEQLHGKPLTIVVGISPANGQYSSKNEIKSFNPLTNGAPIAPGLEPSASAPTGSAPPWQK